MPSPARDAAPPEQEPGIGARQAAASPSPPATAVDAAAIARLRQSVRAWIDGDRVLPVDGSILLASLDQALVGLTEKQVPAARAAIEQFAAQMEALIGAGGLEASDGHPPIEATALLIAGLPSAGATDAETDRRREDSSRAQSRPAAEHSLTHSGHERRLSRSERNTER
jgi:hypothetical protein